MKRFYQRIRHLIILQPRLTTLFLLTLILAPLLAFWERPSQMEVIKQQQQLRIVTYLSPSTYYTTGSQFGGFEYELAQRFAEFIGVELSIIVAGSMEDIYRKLRLNDAHLATAGLNVTPSRKHRFDFGPDYIRSKTFVVYLQRKGNPAPKNVADLRGHRIEVIGNSSHSEILERQAAKLREASRDPLTGLLPENSEQPALSWQTSDDLDVIDLLEKVHNEELDYTLVDEYEFNAHKAFLPRLKVAFTIDDHQRIAWMMKQGLDGSLKDQLILFFAQPEIKAEVKRLRAKYFSSNQRLNLVDNLTFRNHFEERFPSYRELFQEAGETTGIDWQLLAAIGYQESHWNPKAVSPTGVRGIMMLTQQTAKELGVKKRTDPVQSIRGGSRYFAQQRERLPDRIKEPDRTWLALAAYNVGRGHLEDARILTERAGKNPDKWEDVAEHLPLLTQPRWYKTVRYGYARGREPVTYVNNIRRYVEQIRLEERLSAVLSAQEDQQAPAEEEDTAPPPASPEALPETL